MAALVYFVILLALTGHSSAIYCVCKDGVGDSALQRALDYACGAGADCSPILQNGACYQPNTIKDHCSYAVNSYFQRKGQTAQSCDFSGAASQSQTTPSTASSTCVYPASTRICRLVEPLTLHKLQETWRILPTEATTATTKQQERIGGKSHISDPSFPWIYSHAPSASTYSPLLRLSPPTLRLTVLRLSSSSIAPLIIFFVTLLLSPPETTP